MSDRKHLTIFYLLWGLFGGFFCIFSFLHSTDDEALFNLQLILIWIGGMILLLGLRRLTD
jgi:hypothetical protein